MAGPRTYDLLYRTWAPWDRVGVRAELLEVLRRGEVTPATHPRVIDVGCGTGASVVHLARLGFEVTGVDFSQVALDQARARARDAEVEDRCHLLAADLTALDLLPDEGGGFDLLVDGGTLDDLNPAGREILASHLARLARPGALLLCWCFYAARDELPVISFTGPSRVTPAIEPGEEQLLFGSHFEVERIERSAPYHAFIELRRRAAEPRVDG